MNFTFSGLSKVDHAHEEDIPADALRIERTNNGKDPIVDWWFPKTHKLDAERFVNECNASAIPGYFYSVKIHI